MYLKFDGSAALQSGASNGLNLWASASGQTIQGGDLNDVLGGVGSDTLIGGLGDNQYYLSGTGNVIVQGATGVNTVTTWMSYTLPDNIQNLNVTGDNLYAVGNALDNLITVGDTHGMTLYGAAGDNVLVGGAGTDTFVIDNSTPGADAIYNWHVGDTIRLIGGSPLQSFADVQAAMVQQGADVVVHNGAHDFVIRDATISQFTASDFYLALDASKLGALTFDDEFNSLRLRTASNPGGTWTPQYDYGGIGSYTLTGNGELQIYTQPGFTGTGTTDLGVNPFSISNGVLDIHAQTLTAAQSAAMWGYGYSSGVLTTKQSFAQTYGYFEMRAELPTDVSGAWPAFWLVPADGSWPPELDAMEQLSGSPNLIYTTEHSAATGTHTAIGAADYIPDPTGFHTYGVLWTPAALVWFVDGQEVFQTATPADMNKPMYMIANMAVGGWAGTPNFVSTDMKIDYIRAYALADGSSSWTSSVTPDTPGALASGGGSSGSIVTTGSGGTTTVGSGSTTTTAVATGDAVYVAPQGVTSITLVGSRQTVTGNDAGDTFISNNTGNRLIGGAGADAFDIGRGGDVVTGGDGADRFVFAETPWAAGHITDFTAGQDVVEISGLLARSGYTGSDPVADGYIRIVADAAGAQIWSNLDPVSPGAGWWLVTTLDGVSASVLQLHNGVISGVPIPPPEAPAGLALASIANGYVGLAGDTAGQTLTGTADPGAVVTLYDGGQAIGAPVAADANGNWSITLGVLADGAHSLTATASNGAGVSGASPVLSFTVDTQAPGPPSALADAAILNGYVGRAGDVAGQTLTGTAEAGAVVTVFDGAQAIGSVAADAAGRWSFALGVFADGAHQLSARAADAAGNTGAASAVLGFTVDTQAPASPTGLADAAIVNGYVDKAADTAGQKLTGAAEAGAAVTVFDGGQVLGVITADALGHWTFALGVLAEGPHQLTASATDAAGNTGAASAGLAFTVDTHILIPAVADVVQNAAGQTVISGVTDPGSTVAIADGARPLGSAITTASGSWSFAFALSGAGVHSFTQSAMDPAGNVASSAGVTLYSAQPNQTLVGGAGADVLIGRGGDTLTGGAGADHFVFNGAFGKETIQDFTPGVDEIQLDHAFVPDLAHVLAAAQQVGADVTITIGRNDVLTLHNVTLGALHAADFLFF
jgi:beta-glucanase (GH16 family)